MLTQDTCDLETLSKISHSLQKEESVSKKDLDEMVSIYRRNEEDKNVTNILVENLGFLGEILEKDQKPQNIENVSNFSSNMIKAFFLAKSDSISTISNQQQIIKSMEKILNDQKVDLSLGGIKCENLSSNPSYLLMVLCQRTQNNPHSYMELVCLLQNSTKDNPREFIERCIRPSRNAPEMSRNIYRKAVDNAFNDMCSRKIKCEDIKSITNHGLKDEFMVFVRENFPNDERNLQEMCALAQPYFIPMTNDR